MDPILLWRELTGPPLIIKVIDMTTLICDLKESIPEPPHTKLAVVVRGPSNYAVPLSLHPYRLETYGLNVRGEWIGGREIEDGIDFPVRGSKTLHFLGVRGKRIGVIRTCKYREPQGYQNSYSHVPPLTLECA